MNTEQSAISSQPSAGEKLVDRIEQTRQEVDHLIEQLSLPLDAERVITINDCGHKYVYRLRRIGADDWQRYADGFVAFTEKAGQAETTTIEGSTAADQLVRACVVSVEGYRGDFSGMEWKKMLPPRHTGAVARVLYDVEVAQDQGEALNLMGIEVRLDATWNDGTQLKRYQGLVHCFTAPTAEHVRKYNRANSQFKVLGDRQSGVTQFPQLHALLVKFYDELIQSVDGYSVGGKALAGVEQIRAEMDAMHKVRAVRHLLDPTAASAAVAPGEAAAA